MDGSENGDTDGDGNDGGRAVVLAVIACTFFVGFGGGVVFPILPNLGAVLGISPFTVGLILSANRFTRLFANAPSGALVDRVGTRTPFVVGLFVEGVATLGYDVAIASSAPEAWFLLARIAWGVGSALVFATAYTITADVSDAGSRGTSMGLVRVGITFGFPAGLVLGGIVSDRYSVAVAFALAAGFALVASALAYLTVPETHVDGDRAGEAVERRLEPPGADGGARQLRPVLLVRRRAVRDARAVSRRRRRRDVRLHRAGHLRVPDGDHGARGVGVHARRREGERRPRRAGARPARLARDGRRRLPAARGRGLRRTLAVACLFAGAGQGGVGGPLLALLADLTPEDRMGRATGTNNVLGDVGGGLGPMVSLPAIEAVGFGPVYATCALIPAAAGLVLLAGVCSYTGTLNPGVEGEPAD